MDKKEFLAYYLEQQLIEEEKATKGPDICVCLRCWEKRYKGSEMCFTHMKDAHEFLESFKSFSTGPILPR